MDQIASTVTRSSKAQSAAAKYWGHVAADYEAKRQGQEKWKAEDRILKAALADLPAETRLLDIPCGTGRFFPFYQQRGFSVLGLDISTDMLAIAERKISRPDLIQIKRGDIFAIDLPESSVDLAIAIRIMNRIGEEDMQAALRELQRVTKSNIIFNLRVWHPKTRFRNPHKLEAVDAALEPGWSIAEDVQIHEPDFRMLRLTKILI